MLQLSGLILSVHGETIKKRLNMELDLQSFKVYLGSMCTAVLIGKDPSSPLRIWAHIRERYWSANIDDMTH